MKAPDYVHSVVGVLSPTQSTRSRERPCHQRRGPCGTRPPPGAARSTGTSPTSYLHGVSSDNDMMSYERSNNRGELVGRVVASRALEDAVVRRGGGNGGRERLRRLTRADVEVLL